MDSVYISLKSGYLILYPRITSIHNDEWNGNEESFIPF